jgi:hypothetical protein
MAADYVAVLGRLVTENGRDAVDATVAEYADRRVRASLPSAAHTGASRAWHGTLDALVAAEPDACVQVMAGHMLWYRLDDLRQQGSADYETRRDAHGDAGFHVPPPTTMLDIQNDFQIALHTPERANVFVRDLLRDWEPLLLKLDALDGNVLRLCNTAVLRGAPRRHSLVDRRLPACHRRIRPGNNLRRHRVRSGRAGARRRWRHTRPARHRQGVLPPGPAAVGKGGFADADEGAAPRHFLIVAARTGPMAAGWRSLPPSPRRDTGRLPPASGE